MLKYLVSCWLMASAFYAMAQVRISGTIYDKISGQPLEGAHIIVQNTLIHAVSKSDGTYSLSFQKQGRYTLRVTFVGFEPFETQVELFTTKVLDIYLVPRAILGEEVVIQATRAGTQTPVAVSAMQRPQIQELNRGVDFPLLIEALPSVVSTTDAGNGIGYTALRIRGTDMNRINITVNGIPLNDAESHGVWWVDLPDFASSVDNIQVQRGVGTSTNGAAAFGASINIQTRHAEPEPYTEILTGFGSFNTQRYAALFGTGVKRGFSFDGRMSKISSDGYIDRASSNLSSWYLSGSWFGRKWTAMAKMFSGNEKTYQAWDGVPSAMLASNRTYNGMGRYTAADGSIAYYDNETDNYRQDHYQLFVSHEPAKTTLLNVALHYTRGYGFYEQFKEQQQLGHYLLNPIKLAGPWAIAGSDTLWLPDSIIQQSDLIRRKFLDNHFYGLTWSVQYKQRDWDLIAGGAANQYVGDHYGTVIWARYFPGAMINHRWYENKGLKNDLNIFTKITWKFQPALIAFADLQYRYIDYRIDGTDDDHRRLDQRHLFRFMNPKAGITYQPSSRHRWFISYATAQREPNRSNFTDADPGQPMPVEEKLHDFEAGYHYNGQGRMAGATLYYMYYNNQLVHTGKINDVGEPVMTNVPESYRTGIELEASVQPFPWLVWSGNATLSRSIIKNFTEYIDNWDEWGTQIENPIGKTNIAFSPSVVASSIIRIAPSQRWQALLKSKYVGSQYIDNTSSAERRLEPYWVNDFTLLLRLPLPFANKAEMNLSVINFLNHQYESNAWVYRYFLEGEYHKMDGYFPQAGRHYMAGLTLRF